ncbi:MAG TPA: adenosylcobinamide-GDP ribazoletransferase [Mycobacteriales bacterium]|nr:adenosylcobinamide-GDP ribazoletransferase [Mycobacteriales bacterium]
MSGRLRPGARLAIGTFTVVPVRPDPPTPGSAGAAMLLAPVVGLLLGAIAGMVLVAVRVVTDVRPSTPLLAAVLAVIALALLTRALHLDGLADTADGLGSMRPPAEAVAIMRRPDIGPFGVTALLLVLLAQVAALTYATAAELGTEALLVATMTGRLAVTLSCTPATPAAAETGLGRMVAGTVRRRDAIVVMVVVLGLAGFIGVVGDGGRDVGSGLRCIVAAGSGLVAAQVLRWHAVRRLGGVTGDVLGALVEVTTTVVLVAMAVA